MTFVSSSVSAISFTITNRVETLIRSATLRPHPPNPVFPDQRDFENRIEVWFWSFPKRIAEPLHRCAYRLEDGAACGDGGPRAAVGISEAHDARTIRHGNKVTKWRMLEGHRAVKCK
jgi:hypothetical protein